MVKIWAISVCYSVDVPGYSGVYKALGLFKGEEEELSRIRTIAHDVEIGDLDLSEDIEQMDTVEAIVVMEISKETYEVLNQLIDGIYTPDFPVSAFLPSEEVEDGVDLEGEE